MNEGIRGNGRALGAAPGTSRDRTDPAAFIYYRRLGRVKSYVDRHLGDAISLKTAARIANLEEKYFSAFFARKTGTCFMQWLRQRRVKRAISLMCSNNASITEIAFAAGFRDLRTFERTFKKCTGRTARDYKHAIAIRSDSASAA